MLAHGSPGPCNGSTLTPDTCKGSALTPRPHITGGPCGPAMLNTGVVPVFRWPPSPQTIPAGALAEPPGFTVVSGEVLGLIGTVPLTFTRSDLERSLHKLSQQTSIDLSDLSTFLSVCPFTSGYMKTRDRSDLCQTTQV